MEQVLSSHQNANGLLMWKYCNPKFARKSLNHSVMKELIVYGRIPTFDQACISTVYGSGELSKLTRVAKPRDRVKLQTFTVHITHSDSMQR